MEAKNSTAPVKSNVTGVKNAFLVIIACFVVAVCAFLFFFGAPSHFEYEGEAPASMWFFEGEAHPSDLIGTIFKGGIIVPILQT
ncbi:MAG: MotA/TolQ/ExbB proton channel family protein, partial [Muribaculaceae bacterium]|nr:MotA/TolQ/ExbB proton channel family protein [Muribaculaceae bacterium]